MFTYWIESRWVADSGDPVDVGPWRCLADHGLGDADHVTFSIDRSDVRSRLLALRACEQDANIRRKDQQGGWVPLSRTDVHYEYRMCRIPYEVVEEEDSSAVHTATNSANLGSCPGVHVPPEAPQAYSAPLTVNAASGT